MKIRQQRNAIKIEANPAPINMMRFNFGISGLWVWSKITNPRPPNVNMKLAANPSMMYWPFTRYGMNATGLKIYQEMIRYLSDHIRIMLVNKNLP